MEGRGEGLLVVGRTGQLAGALARLAPEARFLARDEADLDDAPACAAAIRAAAPRAVINAAAYTAVDRAETDRAAAWRANADAPGAMAAACADLGIPFLHVSTDYVFDGTGDAPRAEDAATGPLSVYGASKREGENAVAAAGGRWAVLRTSWVFSARGRNFVRSMLDLGAARDHLTVVDDQIGGPTPADDLGRALLRMAAVMGADAGAGGLYHLAGRPDISWAGFARAILAAAKLPCRVVPIPSAAYPTAARRPANSRLDCTAIARDFGIARPDWRAGLAQVVGQLQAEGGA